MRPDGGSSGFTPRREARNLTAESRGRRRSPDPGSSILPITAWAMRVSRRETEASLAADSPLEEARFEPAVPVRRMYVNTEIAADREQPSRRLAGKRQNCRVGTAA